jgi:hypothetical protein
MIAPQHRPIAAGLALFVSFAPLATTGLSKGSAQSAKNAAETDHQNRLESVAKEFLAENCYLSNEVTVGAEFLVQGRSQSVCVMKKDGDRFGFIEYQKQTLTVTDSFSRKQVNAKISTLGAKK